jgi:hypothetical protein
MHIYAKSGRTISNISIITSWEYYQRKHTINFLASLDIASDQHKIAERKSLKGWSSICVIQAVLFYGKISSKYEHMILKN